MTRVSCGGRGRGRAEGAQALADLRRRWSRPAAGRTRAAAATSRAEGDRRGVLCRCAFVREGEERERVWSGWGLTGRVWA
jgi:hypothetical protein